MKKLNYTLIILFICFITQNAQENPKLKFNSNGEFKIVQFTDTHINFDKKSNLNVYEIVKKVITIEKPDFVIFTGDNVTESKPQHAYQLLEDLFAEVKTPWAAVFGNHDGQSGVSREVLADFLSNLPYCLNNDDKEDEVYGYSNFILPVYGRNNEIDALIYCMDSNNYSTLKPTVSGYGWFDFSQINWYMKKSKEYTSANHGNSLPALAFFHIPLPEYTDAWNNKINPPLGVKNEDECSPDINTGMFSAMLECGDVMGTFVGHDHINDYIGVHYNIALAYGRVTKVMRNPDEDPLAGGRVILLKEGERKFDTWVRDMDGKRELDWSYPASISIEGEDKQ